MPPKIIYLHSLRLERGLRVAALQHGMAGFLLLLTGLGQLQEINNPHALFTWLAILSGAIVLVAVVFELRSLRKHEHMNFGWVDLFSAPVLFIEGMHKLHLGKKYLPYVYFILAVLMLARAFLHTRIAHLRCITLDDSGFFARTSLFRKLQLQWHEVRTMESNGSNLNIVTTNGITHVIDLKGIRNKEEAQRQLVEFYHQIKTPHGKPLVEQNN